MSHSRKRLAGDFFVSGTHVKKTQCPACQSNRNLLTEPLVYFWEYDFGDPEHSIRAGLHCLWDGTEMMVGEAGRRILTDLDWPADFLSTKFDEFCDFADVPNQAIPDAPDPLYWVRVRRFVGVDHELNDNVICPECDRFTKNRRQVTRLRVPESEIPSEGIFCIKYNGTSCGPMFATEEAKARIEASGITGIGFSAGGRIC